MCVCLPPATKRLIQASQKRIHACKRDTPAKCIKPTSKRCPARKRACHQLSWLTKWHGLPPVTVSAKTTWYKQAKHVQLYQAHQPNAPDHSKTVCLTQSPRVFQVLNISNLRCSTRNDASASCTILEEKCQSATVTRPAKAPWNKQTKFVQQYKIHQHNAPIKGKTV